MQPVGLKVGAKIMSGARGGYPDRQRTAAQGTYLRVRRCTTSSCGRARARRWRDRLARRCSWVAKEGDYALLKLPSGETRRVLVDCMADDWPGG